MTQVATIAAERDYTDVIAERLSAVSIVAMTARPTGSRKDQSKKDVVIFS
jgi:hypothetical protein